MKICGILSWYDEAPHWLATAVAGFARVCDLIVAVDGAYALYPGARPCSHPQQAEAVLSAAEAAGVACLLHRPQKLFFGNEVEKRNLTLRLAAPFLGEDDWVLAFDADCHVFKCDQIRVRGELENTDALLASYTFLNVEDAFVNPDLARLSSVDDFSTESTGRTRDIYRWHPSLLYGPQHWVVSREFDGERLWLRHSKDGVDSHDLDASLVVYHRSRDRAKVRQDAQQGYYDARELHGVEEMLPGDPAANGVGLMKVRR